MIVENRIRATLDQRKAAVDFDVQFKNNKIQVAGASKEAPEVADDSNK